MTLSRHALSIVLGLALALAPGAPAGAAPRAVIVLHPGGRESPPRTVLDRLAARPQLSIGLLGATQGRYSARQTLLDMSQGSRISPSGYDPRDLPRLRLQGDRIADWEAAVRRAQSAPATLVPGLMATAVGGAGYAGIGRTGSHLGAVLAAGRDGRVAEVSLGAAADVPGRAAQLLERHRLVVVQLGMGTAADRALDALIAARAPEDLLLVIRTPPRSHAAQFLPAGAAGLGGGTGLLRSHTTRRDGLVAGHDVLPTVLGHLGVAIPKDVRGRPMTVTAAHGRDVEYLRALDRRLRAVPRHRNGALHAILAVLAMVLLAGFVAGRREPALRIAGLALLYVPLTALAAAALAPSRRAEILLMGLGPVVLAAITDRAVPWPRAPAVPGLAAVFAYAADLAFGSPLIVRSILGPNPRFGARWYGIGNELEAALPVLLLVGLAAALGTSPRSRRLAATLGGATLLLGAIVGAGRLGADVGGVITIGAAGAAAVLLSLPGPLSLRTIVLACAAPVLAIFALAAVDLVTGGDSHFTATILGADDAGALEDVVRRRFTLAFNSLTAGLMPLATAVALGLLAWGVRRRDALFAPVGDRPAWTAALGGGAAAGVIGSLANDSGPVLLVIAVAGMAAATAYVQGGDQLRPPRD